ncbi:MAG: hypothetical protein N2255_06845, partial [Kiritimatiellae bacterium]|nr:hypothetical protein [Kiritimatiellia bacterium]
MARMGKFVLLACVGYTVGVAPANDLRVGAVSLENVGTGTADVEFDLSWSNSWRTSWSDDGGKTYVTNWDAAWVFIKFRAAGGHWRHAWLADTGHTVPPGVTITVCGNGGVTNVGALIYRATEGHGSMVCPNVRLRWNMAANGIGGTNLVDISVHAIEMVYIPCGAFWVGSGGDETGHFYTYPNRGSPYKITNEDAIVVGTSVGNLWYDREGDRGGPIPAAFPKGYAPFY